jgi:hypothetical protein
MPLNWFLEWKKWILITNEESYTNRRNSFFAGIVSSMFTPAMVGQLAGRFLFSESIERGRITVLTLQSNFSQFLVTLFFGGIAILFVEHLMFFDASAGIVWSMVCLFAVVYFLPERFLRMVIGNAAGFLCENQIRSRFLFFSFLRHLVFSVQFFCVLLAFGAGYSKDLFYWIWVVYLLVTLVPSLFLGKLVIRESIAVFVLTSAGIGIQHWIVLVSSLSIWMVNLLLPSFLALLFLRSHQTLNK